MPRQVKSVARSRREDILSTPRGPAIIRPGRPTDAAAFRALRLEALKAHPEAFAAAYETEASEPHEFWVNRLPRADPESDGALLFAETSAGLAGMAGIWRRDGRKVRHSATIWGVYVRPEWRGHRIGEALVLACVEWARRRRLRIVRLATLAANRAAVRCYERCGFTPYGLEPEALFFGGTAYDDLLMALPIASQPGRSESPPGSDAGPR